MKEFSITRQKTILVMVRALVLGSIFVMTPGGAVASAEDLTEKDPIEEALQSDWGQIKAQSALSY